MDRKKIKKYLTNKNKSNTIKVTIKIRQNKKIKKLKKYLTIQNN